MKNTIVSFEEWKTGILNDKDEYIKQNKVDVLYNIDNFVHLITGFTNEPTGYYQDIYFEVRSGKMVTTAFLDDDNAAINKKITQEMNEFVKHIDNKKLILFRIYGQSFGLVDSNFIPIKTYIIRYALV